MTPLSYEGKARARLVVLARLTDLQRALFVDMSGGGALVLANGKGGGWFLDLRGERRTVTRQAGGLLRAGLIEPVGDVTGHELVIPYRIVPIDPETEGMTWRTAMSAISAGRRVARSGGGPTYTSACAARLMGAGSVVVMAEVVAGRLCVSSGPGAEARRACDWVVV